MSLISTALLSISIGAIGVFLIYEMALSYHSTGEVMMFVTSYIIYFFGYLVNIF